MKKALVVVLVVLVVATGLPVIMGMGGMAAACHDCGPAVLVASCTVAVLAAAITLLVLLLAVRHSSRRDVIRLLLHSYLLERPPRLA